MVSICGVLIEPRRIVQIYKNIINFQDCLPGYPLQIYVGKNMRNYHMEQIKKHYPGINTQYITLFELSVTDLNFATYSNLMKSKDFYDNIQTDYFITIQTDGCLCKNSTHKIEEYLKYDYVGGYSKQGWWWKETKGLHAKTDYQCFNGGFSLRNKNACLSVINTYPSNTTEKWSENIDWKSYAEDLYFVVGLLKLGYKVALDQHATSFCSHTSFVENSFCIHKLHAYVKKPELNNCIKYCPEYKDFIL